MKPPTKPQGGPRRNYRDAIQRQAYIAASMQFADPAMAPAVAMLGTTNASFVRRQAVTFAARGGAR